MVKLRRRQGGWMLMDAIIGSVMAAVLVIVLSTTMIRTGDHVEKLSDVREQVSEMQLRLATLQHAGVDVKALPLGVEIVKDEKADTPTGMVWVRVWPRVENEAVDDAVSERSELGLIGLVPVKAKGGDDATQE